MRKINIKTAKIEVLEDTAKSLKCDIALLKRHCADIVFVSKPVTPEKFYKKLTDLIGYRKEIMVELAERRCSGSSSRRVLSLLTEDDCE